MRMMICREKRRLIALCKIFAMDNPFNVEQAFPHVCLTDIHSQQEEVMLSRSMTINSGVVIVIVKTLQVRACWT